MIQLPKSKPDPKDANLCKCRPVCKNRRRNWKGEVQNTSAELLLERKPLPLCYKRWPTKVFPNSPCPLFARTRGVYVKERGAKHIPHVVRICQAPIDKDVDTPYLRYAQMARDMGALDAIQACCSFCQCGVGCPCTSRDYVPQDAEQMARCRSDMCKFDARVKADHQSMRIMYDKI